MRRAETYPIDVFLEGRKCLIAGGGEVAARKVRDLLACGAGVTVVSPTICEALRAMTPQLEWKARAYRSGDEKDAFLVFAATDNPAVNAKVAKAAKAAGALVNVADDPDNCDFFVPSKVIRGKLMLTVSTNGAVPAFSKKIRRELQEQFGPEYKELLELIADARAKLLERDDLDTGQRKIILEQIMELDLLEKIKNGESDKAKEEIESCIFRS